jgi:hypothetical protein
MVLGTQNAKMEILAYAGGIIRMGPVQVREAFLARA